MVAPHVSRDDEPAGSRQAQDLLPPVSPPDASFLMQLFVTPMLIVGLLVGGWFLLQWVARPQQDPRRLVAEIGKLNHRSWQQALALANQLRDETQKSLRQDARIAADVGRLLDQQLSEPARNEDQIRLRIYLCRALGEFECDAGVGTLAAAAASSNASLRVRRAAIQSLGMLAIRLGPATWAHEDTVLGPIVAATRNETIRDEETPSRSANENDEAKAERRRLRSSATYVLGLMGGKVAEQRLTELLSDQEPDVHHNAVTALARLGQVACVPGLLAMLRATAVESSEPTPDALERDWKGALIVSAAVRATATLAQVVPDLDATPFLEPLSVIARDAGHPRELRLEARDVLKLLSRRTPASEPAKP
ncbi:MAG TPA: hypothetical protein VIY86_13850 [Pirellulaceae bacterium]